MNEILIKCHFQPTSILPTSILPTHAQARMCTFLQILNLRIYVKCKCNLVLLHYSAIRSAFKNTDIKF